MSQPPYPPNANPPESYPPDPYPPGSNPSGSYPPGYPPGQAQYLPPQPRRSNPAAIVSLVTGILFCIPLAGFIALITGIVGLAKAKNPMVGGRGMAVAGLILGVLGVFATVGEVGFGLAARRAVHEGMSSPAHAVAARFAADLPGGNTDTILGECDSNINRQKVMTTIDDAKSWGPLKESHLYAIPFNLKNSPAATPSISVAGIATYANSVKNVNITVSNPDTNPKVSDFSITSK